jgi:hypothetical protein
MGVLDAKGAGEFQKELGLGENELPTAESDREGGGCDGGIDGG